MRKKKNWGNVCILIISFLLLVGCNGKAETDTQDTDTQDANIEQVETDLDAEQEYTREVVFSHRIEWFFIDAVYLHEPELNGWYEEVTDKNVLYAYAVYAHIIPEEIESKCLSEVGDLNDEAEREKYFEKVENFKKEQFLKMGFVIVENHPDASVVIAGTKEQLDTLFVKNLGEVDGWRFCALKIVRPDMDDILRQTGWTEDKSKTFWFSEHYEEILPLLGTDADQVVLTVPVILPEETVQTTE